MKRDRIRTELDSLIYKKNKLLVARKNNLDTVSGHTIDTSKLIEAKRIAEKLDKGEFISEQDRDKLKDIKSKYESFFDDGNITDKDGLEDAISYVRDEKESYISKDLRLKEKTKELAEKTKELGEETKELGEKIKSIGNVAKSKGSLLDDFADLATEMPDIIDD